MNGTTTYISDNLVQSAMFGIRNEQEYNWWQFVAANFWLNDTESSILADLIEEYNNESV
jgi:hypothetical protein